MYCTESTTGKVTISFSVSGEGLLGISWSPSRRDLSSPELSGIFIVLHGDVRRTVLIRGCCFIPLF